jgi:hypothetical protein
MNHPPTTVGGIFDFVQSRKLALIHPLVESIVRQYGCGLSSGLVSTVQVSPALSRYPLKIEKLPGRLYATTFDP